jgi:RHS repeat-associated protein
MRSRPLVIILGLVLVADLVQSLPVAAAPPRFRPPPLPVMPSVAGATVPMVAAGPDPMADREVRGQPALGSWPTPGSATVTLTAPVAAASHTSIGAAAQAGSLPGSVATVLSAAPAGSTRAGPDAADPLPRQVRVDLLDRTESSRVGIPGVLLRVQRTDTVAAPGRVRLTIDYASFRNLFGADWSSRLRLESVPNCALTTPQPAGCQASVVPSTNDVAHSQASALVNVPAAGGASMLAVTSGPSGSTGDFSVKPLAASATWQESGSTGAFTWSYPVRVPPSLGGPAPQLSLAYSSQGVDGRTAVSNNQPSWIGEGWDLWSGYVERGYKSCTDDLGGNANNAVATGDECWGTDNAMLSLNGHAVDLLKDSSGVWHPRNDDGSRIEHLTGASNGDNDGEYWRVTTTNGTQYYFGLNHLPGWTSGRPETGSTWTVPVFGNNPGEPCNASTFDSSWCNQAWRWNLDYVVDPHGNSQSYWYSPENNNYGRDNDPTKVSSYVRGGTLSHVDYGTITSAEFGNPPARVTFAVADRCAPGSTCDTAHPASWPDTPLDQACSGSPCTNVTAPTFWSSKRLSSITTQVLNGSTYQNVDTWTLRQTFPDPGDGTRAGLWLAGITHTGQIGGGSLALPEVTFTGVQMNNRVDATGDGAPPMNWWRVSQIDTESGDRIAVVYSAPACTAGSLMPPESNTLRCFPVFWTPQGATAPKLDWFQKYVVTDVSENDLTGGAPRVITHYEYVGNPAWHYDDDDGLVPASRKTWGDWRGYQTVRTYRGDTGEQQETQTTYFTGMNGDKLPSGTRSVVVTDSTGTTVADDDALAAEVRESIVYNGPNGATVTDTINGMFQSGPTASRTINGFTVNARMTGIGQSETKTTLDGGRAPLMTKVVNTFDSLGMVSTINDLGDESTPNDDVCTRYTYARNSTSWLMAFQSRVEKYAQSCEKTPATADDVISDTRMSFDGASYGTAPTKGDATTVEQLSSWASGTPGYFTEQRMAYDASGRLTDTADANNAHTTIAYTPGSGGPVTQVATTNPLNQTATVTLDPSLGLTTAAVDANGKRTDATYDALGRLSSVWRPGEAKATAPANTVYSYALRNNGASGIGTRRLASDGSTYITSYELFDGLLRPRQTQAPAPGGGRDITDTFYNTAGLAVKHYGAYYNSSAPAQDLFGPTDATQVPDQTATSYDGAGRVTASIFQPGGTEQWRTTTGYGGDRTDVTPPAGGTASSTVVDGRGRTLEYRQYAGTTPTGTYDKTDYTYNRKGQLISVVNPAGDTWSHGYDIRGRQTASSDPDQGTAAFTYDNLNQKLTATDARGQTLAYTYDALGRQTGVFQGSTSGTQLTQWVYDTVLKGQLSSTTRYVSGNAYVTAFAAYNDRYEPTSQSVTIPSAEGALAGTYTYRFSYNIGDGTLASTRFPAAGDLAAETVRDTYTSDVDLLSTVSGQSTYVTQTDYTKIGQLARITLTTGGSTAWQSYIYETGTNRLSQSYVDGENSTPSEPVHDGYTYDPAGNITKIADTPGGGLAVDNQCFSYDYLRRLTQAWTPSSGNCATAPATSGLGGPAPYWQSWTFDKAGDRLSQVDHAGAGDTTTTYAYPVAGQAQPHALQSTTASGPLGSKTLTYAYDAAGHTTSRPGASANQTLTWDSEGNLASMVEGSSASSYVYDTSGSVLVRRDSGGATLYLPGMELRLNSSSGTPNAIRFYAEGTRNVAVRTAGGVAWQSSDPQRTSQLSMDSGTQALTERRQTPFGAARGTAVTWPTDKGFVGGTIEPLGLIDLGAREYDPGVGRFISVDPLIDFSDPQQMQGYAYADNSPITQSDPSGKMTVCADSCGEPGTSAGPQGGVPGIMADPIEETGNRIRTAINAPGDWIRSVVRTMSPPHPRSNIIIDLIPEWEPLKEGYTIPDWEPFKEGFSPPDPSLISGIEDHPVLGGRIGISIGGQGPFDLFHRGGVRTLHNNDGKDEKAGDPPTSPEEDPPGPGAGSDPYKIPLDEAGKPVGGHSSGTGKPPLTGGTPDSIHTQTGANGTPVQNTIYNEGDAVGHFDFKDHGTGGPHGHVFEPGDPRSGHGPGAPHIPATELPPGWDITP